MAETCITRLGCNVAKLFGTPLQSVPGKPTGYVPADKARLPRGAWPFLLTKVGLWPASAATSTALISTMRSTSSIAPTSNGSTCPHSPGRCSVAERRWPRSGTSAHSQRGCQVPTPDIGNTSQHWKRLARRLEDGYDNLYDRAIVVSADSDLVPVIEQARRRFIDKTYYVAAPPGQFSAARGLASACHGFFEISPARIEKCLLPERITGDAGTVLTTRPLEYAPPR